MNIIELVKANKLIKTALAPGQSYNINYITLFIYNKCMLLNVPFSDLYNVQNFVQSVAYTIFSLYTPPQLNCFCNSVNQKQSSSCSSSRHAVVVTRCAANIIACTHCTCSGISCKRRAV